MEDKQNYSLAKLFWSNFIISACTFGGGFVIISFMKKKYADELHWFDEQEMLDMVALAQSVPGPVAVNTSILVGWRVAGFIGMVLSVLGTIIPPIVVITIISYLYAAFIENPYVNSTIKGMQSGVAAIIVSVVIDMAIKVIKKKDWFQIAFMILCFVAIYFFNVGVLYIIIVAIIIGIATELLKKMKEAK